MQTSITGRELELDKDIKEYTQHKIIKLDKYRSDIIGIEVTLEENHHQKIKQNAFLAKSLIKIPGNDINAEAYGKTLFSAVDALEKKLASQLRKTKEKRLGIKGSKDFFGKFFRKE